MMRFILPNMPVASYMTTTAKSRTKGESFGVGDITLIMSTVRGDEMHYL